VGSLLQRGQKKGGVRSKKLQSTLLEGKVKEGGGGNRKTGTGLKKAPQGFFPFFILNHDRERKLAPCKKKGV